MAPYACAFGGAPVACIASTAFSIANSCSHGLGRVKCLREVGKQVATYYGLKAFEGT